MTKLKLQSIEDDARADLRKIESGFHDGKPPMGFWKVVEKVKMSNIRAEDIIAKIAEIDAESFRKRHRHLDTRAGSVLAGLLTLLGVLVVYEGASSYVEIVHGLFVVGIVMVIIGIHPLVHIAVGRYYGIEFLFYFLNGSLRIEPSIKIEYDSYLRASPKGKAIMHLSGVTATFVILSSGLFFGLIFRMSVWSMIVLSGILTLLVFKDFVAPYLHWISFWKTRGTNFAKTDFYRTLREWRLSKSEVNN